MLESEDLKEAGHLIEQGDARVVQANSFRFRGEVYAVGDSVYVTLRKQTLKYSRFVGRICAVYCLADFPLPDKRLPLVRVQYYFDSNTLSNNFKNFREQLSANELFLSDVTALVPVNLISGRAKVVSLADYQDHSTELDMKFCEARYFTQDDRVEPGLNTRARVCQCGFIENPDLNYIMCEGCKKWFHYLCVGISNFNDSLTFNFVCKFCSK